MSSQQATPLEKIPAPTDKYLDWEIESALELLYQRAIEVGEAHSQAHYQRTGQYAPNAYRASVGFKVIEIIRQLQAENAELQKQITDASAPVITPPVVVEPTLMPKRRTRVKKVEQPQDK